MSRSTRSSWVPVPQTKPRLVGGVRGNTATLGLGFGARRACVRDPRLETLATAGDGRQELTTSRCFLWRRGPRAVSGWFGGVVAGTRCEDVVSLPSVSVCCAHCFFSTVGCDEGGAEVRGRVHFLVQVVEQDVTVHRRRVLFLPRSAYYENILITTGTILLLMLSRKRTVGIDDIYLWRLRKFIKGGGDQGTSKGCSTRADTGRNELTQHTTCLYLYFTTCYEWYLPQKQRPEERVC